MRPTSDFEKAFADARRLGFSVEDMRRHLRDHACNERDRFRHHFPVRRGWKVHPNPRWHRQQARDALETLKTIRLWNRLLSQEETS